jgi:hypothetical protein
MGKTFLEEERPSSFFYENAKRAAHLGGPPSQALRLRLCLPAEGQVRIR